MVDHTKKRVWHAWFRCIVLISLFTLNHATSSVIQFPPTSDAKLLNLTFRISKTTTNFALESSSFRFPRKQVYLPSRNGYQDVNVSKTWYAKYLANKTVTLQFNKTNQRLKVLRISSYRTFRLTYDSATGTRVTNITISKASGKSRRQLKDTSTDTTSSSSHVRRNLLSACDVCQQSYASLCVILLNTPQGRIGFTLWKKAVLAYNKYFASRLQKNNISNQKYKTLYQFWHKKWIDSKQTDTAAKLQAENFQAEYLKGLKDFQQLQRQLDQYAKEEQTPFLKALGEEFIETLEACGHLTNAACPCELWNAIWKGDPHIVTFDGLHYDCQAEGEVIITKTLTSDLLEIQGRFTPLTSYVTVTTAIVIKPRGLPTVQLSLDKQTSNLRFVVDGIEKPIGDNKGEGYEVVQVGWTVVVAYPSLQLEVEVSNNGRYLSSKVSISKQTLAGEKMVGLLGSANNDLKDDWMMRNGTPLVVPSGSDLIYQPAYNYCTTNWCLRNASLSLFTYFAGESFELFSKCDKVYDSTVEVKLANPPQCIASACGSNQECLLDGVAFGRAGVDNAKQLERSKLCLPRAAKPCYFSCADALATTCDTTPGLYNICSNTTAPSVLVYCDQATDGGGWMLSYSYKHLSGHDDPVNGSKIPLDPVNGYSHFHLNQLSGYTSSAIESVRFYCQTSGHGRVMHFKNSHPVVSEIAYYGDSNANKPSVWFDTSCYVTKFPDHSARLPETTTSVYGHPARRDGFRTFPFLLGATSHWTIASPDTGPNRYECDDYLGNSLPGAQSTNTTHNIWVKVKEKCCAYGYGNYSGHVTTPSIGSSYDISIQFDESGVRLEYTNLGCGYSTPIPVNVSVVGRFEYLEVLQFGKARCHDLGWVVVSAAYDNVWMFQYTDASSGKVDTASITFDCNRSCILT